MSRSCERDLVFAKQLVGDLLADGLLIRLLPRRSLRIDAQLGDAPLFLEQTKIAPACTAHPTHQYPIDIPFTKLLIDHAAFLILTRAVAALIERHYPLCQQS